MRKKIIITMLVLLQGISPVNWAQEGQKGAPKPETLLRIETELVQLDVLVEDEKGTPVRHLKREDFQVLEGGRPQVISYFSVGSVGRVERDGNQSRAEVVAADPSEPPPAVGGTGRYLVLAIDDLHLGPGSLLSAKQTLQRFLDQQVSLSDQVSLITTSGSLGQFQQFTNERELLHRAVNRLSVRERRVSGSGEIPAISPYQAELIDSNDPESLELAVQEIIQMLRIDRRMATGMAQSRARQIVAENNSVTGLTLSTLENVIRSLKALPGRKVMVLVSDGFLLGGLRESRHYDVRRVTDAATRAGVVIYSIDARGLVALPGEIDASQPGASSLILPGARSRIANGSISAQRDGIYALAADTGGRAIFNTNDLNIGLQRILDDSEASYLLAFEPSVSHRDGRYHKLEVRLPGYRKYRIRSQRGYFSPDDKQAAKIEREQSRLIEAGLGSSKEAGKLRDLQIRNGLSALYPIRDIAIGLSTGFLDTREEGTTIDLSAHIDINGIQFQEEAQRMRAHLELISLIFDESGRTVDTRSDKMDLNLKSETLVETQRNGLAYRRLFKLKPGFYNIRLIVRQEGSLEIGTASSWITIPDLTRPQLILSSIFLTPSESKSDHASELGGMVGDGVKSLVYRRFVRPDTIDFIVFAYNSKVGQNGKADAAIQTQLYTGNKLIHASPLRALQLDDAAEDRNAVDQTRLPYHGRLDLRSFESGRYELRVVVVDRLSRSTAKRSINFQIVR